MKKENTSNSSGKTSNSLNWEIYELKVSKHHAIAFQIDYFIKVIGGGGEGVGCYSYYCSFFYQKNGETLFALS